MKKSTFISILFVCQFSILFAQDIEKNLVSKISAITVYTQAGLVSETGKAGIEAGKTTLIFNDIPSGIDISHIHVHAENGLKILAVVHRFPDVFATVDALEVKPYNDSMQNLKDQVHVIASAKDALMEEKNLLLANKSIGGQNTGVNVTELQKAADFYRARLADINKQYIKLEKQERSINEYVVRLQNKLIELNNRVNSTSHKVAVTVYSSARTNATLQLQYLTSGTGWAPSYDIKVKDINSPIQLDYHAKIFNSTGVPWEGVKLTVSTADPYQSADKPSLTPWTLDYEMESDYKKAYNGTYSGGQGNENAYAPKANMSSIYLDGSNRAGDATVSFSEVYASELSVDFEIKEPGIIPSDGKPYKVDVQSVTLPASYVYFSVPKLDKDAFLVAQVTGWESLNLVEGPADIYYGDNYTGQSYINTRYANDTLDISLGRDKKVTVTRVKKEDYTKSRLLGLSRTDNYIYELSVRNNNYKAISIELYDQVPVAQESDITVDVNEISGAARDNLSGKLTWKMDVAPSETKTVKFVFSVKYPKYRKVKVMKYRKIAAPSRCM